MNHQSDDITRRRWLRALSATGGAGALAAAAPFVASMAPSERARALGAPVEVDLAGLLPGSLKTVEWRGQPIFVLRRTPAMVEGLRRHDALLADPASRRSIQPPYARNTARAIDEETGVLVGLCTHLGCVPTFRPDPGAPDIAADWPGGFYCPCHGSKFDLAGRVFKNVPAPTNLTVPPYRLAGPSAHIVGEDAGA
jgi:ubiquinol-cytochrome c reductase iron-sulfur subunit